MFKNKAVKTSKTVKIENNSKAIQQGIILLNKYRFNIVNLI